MSADYPSMTTAEIRSKFLNFFEERGLKLYPSSSLVPDDPSLLLANAGMNQFKEYYQGKKTMKEIGAISCQKCVRTNDIDCIGEDGRHLSFFEMLGDFSFGGVSKQQACAWAFELITKEFKLPLDRLYFTVFTEDDETHDVWRSLGVAEDHISRLGEDDNFWAAGPTGPCGPCSEIYFDMGEEVGCGSPDCKPGCDCDRFLEFWNLVFTQYDRQEDGSMPELPHRNLDTGMGLERMAAIMQHKTANYDGDLMQHLIKLGEEISGKTYDAVPDLTNCECGGILDIVYDYDYIKSVLTKEKLAKRENRSMWRYRELLPVEETTPDTPLRVGWSPLYEESKLAELLGIKKLWVKDDGQNPTASLKDRASAMAVAKAIEAGAKTIACSSTGNAASSLAGNAAAAGIKTFIFVPERAPQGKVAQLMIFGANVISVKGNYEDTFKMSAAAIEKYGWYNRNAAINPYLSEGKKTVALEIAEQLNWEMPDYLAISVGDGCTIAGVWKGFKDLYAIGFIDKLPRLISAQSLGCYPINRAIQNNEPWEPMEENTIADSISVGVPRNADKALAAIRESNGIAVNVSDEEILAAQRLLGRTCGVFGEPAGVTGAAALKKACELGLIPHDATVVSVVTGNGLKDVANAIKSAGSPVHIEPDLDLMVEEFKKRGVVVE